MENGRNGKYEQYVLDNGKRLCPKLTVEERGNQTELQQKKKRWKLMDGSTE